MLNLFVGPVCVGRYSNYTSFLLLEPLRQSGHYNPNDDYELKPDPHGH